MIAGLLKIITGLWSWFGRILAGIGEWLRQDHDWWRIGCFTMALLFGIASFAAYDQHKTVIVITRTAAADKETCSRIVAEKDAALADYVAQQEHFAEVARTEAANLKVAQDQSAQAQLEVAAAQAQAAKNNAAWWGVYAKRPDSCRAAQEALDVACPSAEDY